LFREISDFHLILARNKEHYLDENNQSFTHIFEKIIKRIIFFKEIQQ